MLLLSLTFEDYALSLEPGPPHTETQRDTERQRDTLMPFALVCPYVRRCGADAGRRRLPGDACRRAAGDDAAADRADLVGGAVSPLLHIVCMRSLVLNDILCKRFPSILFECSSIAPHDTVRVVCLITFILHKAAQTRISQAKLKIRTEVIKRRRTAPRVFLRLLLPRSRSRLYQSRSIQTWVTMRPSKNYPARLAFPAACS